MKIALLTDGISPYVIGGMQKHSYYLCKFLAQKGHIVYLFHCANNQNWQQALSLDCFSEEERKNILPQLLTFPKSPNFPGHYIAESYAYSKEIFKHLEKNLEEIELVYAQGFCAWEYVRQKRTKTKLPPCVVNFHGLNMFQSTTSFQAKLTQYLFRPFVANLLRSADYVHSLGGKLTEITLNLGVSKEKIWEIGIGLDDKWTNIQANEEKKIQKKVRSFVFIGRFERIKGIEELNIVLEKLSTQHFQFHFIGPIPDEKKIQKEGIIYHGLVTEIAKIQDILLSSDVLVSPSHSEGMPTVILEAMACGCAIIATDVGAVSKLVDEKVGWLIPANDLDSLQKSLEAALLVSDENLLAQKRYAIEKVKKDYLWDSVIEKMLAEMNAIIKISK